MKISYENLKDLIKSALINNNVDDKRAELMAKIHADSTLKGVNSHGINRIPRLIKFINEGLINLDGTIELKKAKGGCEVYDGNLGFGVINAINCVERVTNLAKTHGIGMVSLRNTTHWMRGGTYGEMIADNGLIGMCWTNTESVLPLWGSDELSLGNNPIAISIPSESGNICLDMAVSLYSYGKLETTRLKGEKLPYPGGYDKDGIITDDPSKIEETGRLLPVGYWKGSGLGVALDTMAALLSNGKSTYNMDDDDAFNCTGCSQIFIAMDPEIFSSKEENEATIKKIKESIANAHPIEEGKNPRYPGQGLISRKNKNLIEGIEVDDNIYKEVEKLAR